jgi:redox-sensitive bicupin YhaK (pirin superfamily)
MIRIRKADERGHFNHGWLDTYHTFSFASYRDPEHMGFRSLRVMNEDRVQPGQGFAAHPHRDMEIVTYVLEGALEHKDNMGNGSALRPGEFQRMTAGRGITHSEFNPSAAELVHLYQIWISPERKALEPSYEQRAFAEDERRNQFRIVASRDGREGSLTVHQDVAIFLSSINAGEQVSHALKMDRHAWLQVLRGAVELNAIRLAAGDGAAVSEETVLAVLATSDSEVMLFDLA